jgi:hypothetical protein
MKIRRATSFLWALSSLKSPIIQTTSRKK